MNFTPCRTFLSLLLPIAIASGCGGGSEPTIGAAAPDPTAQQPDSQTEVPVTATSISGRVADGYLRGATVCVDINENRSCDDDEPSALSGEGGSYQLDIPAGASDKPIIADVPASAIDEDTGEPIGKKLTLSTPPDRPGFISPITTLIHEAMKENPGLSVDDAESTMLGDLGMTKEDGASLFGDYIAEQATGDGEKAKRYRFLHQTARVLATMMDEIQAEVEQAATEQGIDFTSDESTRVAIHQLVRKEVRELLPEISLAVAEELVGLESANEDTDSPTTETLVDTSLLAEKLDREESSGVLIEKLDAIRDESDAQRVPMQQLLSDGMYWLELECDDFDSPVEGEIKVETTDSVSVVLNDEGVPMPVDMPEYCFAEYGHVMLDDSTGDLVEQQYFFDIHAQGWVELQHEDDEPVYGFHLQEGKWVPARFDGPEGPVEFLDDGGAVLTTAMGKMLVYATSHSLDGTPVVHHIYRRGGDEAFLQNLSKDTLFPADSSVHHLFVKRKSATHMMFNWHPHDEQHACDQFAGNCNVVDIIDDAGFAPATSLDQIRELALYGVNLAGAVHHHREGKPIDLELHAYADSVVENELPLGGTATWFVPPYPEPYDETELVDCKSIDGTYVEESVDSVNLVDSVSGEIADNLIIDQELDLSSGETDELLPPPPPPMEGCHEPGTGESIYYDESGVEEAYPLPDKDSDGIMDKHILGTSEWKVINVGGVTMIEIGLPLPVRYGIDADDHAKFLLIEDGGFVRRGARLIEAESDDVLMYSEPAFKTLQPVAEDYVSNR